MGCVLDAHATSTNNDINAAFGGSSATLNTLTIVAGNALVASLTLGDDSGSATSAGTLVWDAVGANQTMTLIGFTRNAAIGTSVAWYGLRNPVAGNKILSASWSGGSFHIMDASSWTGVDVTSDVIAFANYTGNATGTAANPTIAVTSAVGDVPFAQFAGTGGGSYTAIDNTTLYLLANGTTGYGGAAAYGAGAATVNFTANRAAGSQNVKNGFDLVAAGAAGLPPGGSTFPWGPISRRRRGALEELTWTQSFDLTLFANNQPLIGPYDWPNPRGPRRSRDYTWINTTPLGAPAPTLPVGQASFDTARWPRGPQRLPNYTWTFSANPATIPQPLSPAQITFDWPNPRGPRRAVDLLTWVQSNPVLLNAPAAAPFVPIDWPNPRATRRVIDLITWTQSSPILLFPADTGTPFTPIDWPNPRGPKKDPNLWAFSQGTNPNLFPPSPPDTPPGDPVGAQLFTLGRRSQTFVTRRTLPPSDLPATHVFDWPNPRGARRSYDLLTWISIPPQVIPQPQSPAQITFDWPNPRGPLRARDYTHINSPFIPNIPVPPPPATVTFDWPNPRGPLFPLSLRGFIHSRAPLYPVVNPPIRQYDWPNPRGARRSILLYTWIVPTSPGNAPVPTPNPALMLKNEVVRVRYLLNDTVRVRYLSGDNVR